MNRREAIAALTALPEVARISVAKPQPDDVIVVECEGHISQEAVMRIQEYLNRIWPDRQVIVFEQGVRMRFASK